VGSTCPPVAARKAARARGRAAGRQHRAVCAPFDYIPYSDRQRGGVVPGERVVRIESTNGGYRYERLNTEGYVRLHRQLSPGSARQGTDWGYDRRGIWVNHGFRGEFVVGRPNPGSNSAVPDSRRPPAWVVGTFRGYDEARKATITVTIRPDGSVRHRTNYDGDKRTVDQSGYYRDGRLIFDNARLELDRAGGGIRTTETGGRHGRVSYQRID